jgi:hypothetical protein
MDFSEQVRERQADKDNALAEIAVVLDRLETEARNPDAWERGFLVHALSAQFAGLYRFATMDARLALATPAERGDSGLPIDPALEQCDLIHLQKAFEAARVAPVRLYPVLGPIVLK